MPPPLPLGEGLGEGKRCHSWGLLEESPYAAVASHNHYGSVPPLPHGEGLGEGSHYAAVAPNNHYGSVSPLPHGEGSGEG